LTGTPAANGYELATANALWGQRGAGFKAAFLARLDSTYGAPLREVDFRQSEEARALINDWVEEATRGKIRDLVSQDQVSDAFLMIVNAVYFRGFWEEPFPKTATADGRFILHDGTPVTAPFMATTRRFPYADMDSVQILDLPYRGGDLAMTLVLPDDPGGLPGIEHSLSSARLKVWLSGLEETQVQAFVPRFAITSRFALRAALSALGMEQAFTTGADFSGISDRGLWISDVIHQARIEVDEEGTVAAAATAQPMTWGGIKTQSPPVFRADHPFLFFIRHRASGVILFMGRVENP
jgi:serpin B